MKREFILNIFLLLAINFLIKPLYIFGIETQVQNLVGINAYGLYFDYFNFVVLFQLFNDPGLQNWNTQHLAKNNEEKPSHLAHLLGTKIILSFIFMLLILIAGFIFKKIDFILLIGVAINLILSTTFMLLRSSVSGLGNYRADSWLSAVDKLAMILLIGSYIYLPLNLGVNIYGFVLLQGLSYIIAIVFAFFVLSKEIHINVFWKIDLNKTISIIKSCLPYIWILVFMTIYTRIDGVLLAYLIDDDHYQTGIYAACFRFYDAANMATFLFGSLLYAMYARYSQDQNMLKTLSDLGFRLGLVVSISIATVLIFWGHNIMSIILPVFDIKNIGILSWLMIAFVLSSLGSVFASLLMATGYIKILSTILGLTCVVNLVLHLILIPKYGALGASYTSVATQSFLIVTLLITCKKSIKISLSLSTILKATVFAFFSLLSGYIIAENAGNTSWFIQSIITFILITILTIIFKIIKIDEVGSLLSSKTKP